MLRENVIMKPKIFPTLFIFMLFSCASVEREKYFKASWNSLNHSTYRFPDSKVTVAEDFNMAVENSALITYLGGPIIPFIPVYIFEDMRRDIKENEEITIAYSRTKYLGPFTDHFEGIKIYPPVVQTSESKLFRPKETIVTKHEVKFTYPIKVLETKEFIVRESTLILSNGRTIMTPRVRFTFVNVLDYKCCGNSAP